jgi:uncharacterized protein YndB with AHSA1/START domain
MAKQIEVTRIFDAPVAMVWKLWTDPELVKRWWGPKHFISPIARLDVRVGSISLVSMKAPAAMGGVEWFSVWEYLKIIPLQTIEFVQSLADAAGNKKDPAALGMPADFPKDILTVVHFEILSAHQTSMTVTEYAEFGSISNFAQTGLEQSMDKMLEISF